MPEREPRRGLPAELAARLDDDPFAAGYFHALRSREQEEYIEYVSEAKRPETRIRRAAESVEHLHWRHVQKLGLKARGKAAITRAIDQAVELIAPSLAELGFRKKRRNWWATSPSSTRFVEVAAGRRNITNIGSFQVFLAFGYPAFGPVDGPPYRTQAFPFDMPLGGPHHHRRGPYPFQIDDARDEAQVAAVMDRLRNLWESEFGIELVRAADDPRALREHYLRHGDAEDGLLRGIRLSEVLGDEAVERAAVERFLVSIREDRIIHDPEDPHALAWFANDYAAVVPNLRRLGIDLVGAAREHALATVNATMSNVRIGGEDKDWYVHARKERLIDLAELLGLDIREELEALMQGYSPSWLSWSREEAASQADDEIDHFPPVGGR